MRGNDNADAARRSQPAAAAMDRLRGSGVQSSSGGLGEARGGERRRSRPSTSSGRVRSSDGGMRRR